MIFSTSTYYCLIDCFDIQLNIFRETEEDYANVIMNDSMVRWELGVCSSKKSLENWFVPHLDSGIYTARCCLGPGKHTLVCYNEPPAKGWKNAYIKIDGHLYCDDFVTYKLFQKIVIGGKTETKYDIEQLPNIIISIRKIHSSNVHILDKNTMQYSTENPIKPNSTKLGPLKTTGMLPKPTKYEQTDLGSEMPESLTPEITSTSQSPDLANDESAIGNKT